MVTREGKELRAEKDKVNEFERFWKLVYQTINRDQEEMESLLDGLNIKRISDSQLTMMESSVRQDEIKVAIFKMKNNVAPGLDGFTIKYYKTFIEELAPRLEDLYCYVLRVRYVPESSNEAKIVRIPKPHETQKRVESYKPITLLNSDYKTLAAIIGTRLKKVIGSLIHYEQTGFLKNYQMKDNVRKVLNIIWGLIKAVIQHMGLGMGRERVYRKPQAIIRVNDLNSDPISLTRGIQQGFLLSPLLFNISLEALAVGIMQDCVIKGPECRGNKF